jgi:PIN domain
MHLFPDTHFFLHFKHAQELPWSDVTAADPIVLVVGRTVQKEIEKHKHEKRGRVQDRAREYSSKLATIALQPSPIEIRANAPKVMLDFSPGHPKGWSNPADLNAGWADDMMVADALAFQHDNPAANVAILTGDPGLIATATAQTKIGSLIQRTTRSQRRLRSFGVKTRTFGKPARTSVAPWRSETQPPSGLISKCSAAPN